MSETQKLLTRIEALAERKKISTSTIGRELFGNGQRFDEIKAGGSLTLAVYERALTKLAELEAA